MPRRRAISRVGTRAENFRRIISRTWRIATLSAGIGRSFGFAKGATLSVASGDARRLLSPRAGLSRSGGRHHIVLVGDIIPLRRARSSRFGGRLQSESAGVLGSPPVSLRDAWRILMYFQVHCGSCAPLASWGTCSL
jgi:hypothetical protein